MYILSELAYLLLLISILVFVVNLTYYLNGYLKLEILAKKLEIKNHFEGK